MKRWADKIAVVTGASSGIGAATAIELVRAGMKVVAVARRYDRLKELEKDVGSSGVLFTRKCDVSKEIEVKELFSWIKKTFGTIHVIVNNAGVARYGKIYDQNPKYWKEILDTNLLGLAICTQESLQLMKESNVDDGHIININSILGHYVPLLPIPVAGMYPASKHAVTALTETIRQELLFLKSNIRITSISPGTVETEISKTANNSLEPHERLDTSLLDAPRPTLYGKDIADAIIFVLSAPPHVQVHEMIIKPVGEPV